MNIIKRLGTLGKNQTGNSNLHTRRRTFAIVIVLALVGAFALVEIILAHGAASPTVSSTSTSTPPLPPAKATLLARSQQAIATAQAAPQTPKPTNVTSSADVPTATLTAGITYEHQGPFSNSDFSIDDVYRGQVNGQWVIIYAGTAWINFPTKGVGALKIYNLDGGFSGVLDTTDGSDNLKIIGVSGTTLQITSDKGTHLTFDMATDTWSGS